MRWDQFPDQAIIGQMEGLAWMLLHERRIWMSITQDQYHHLLEYHGGIVKSAVDISLPKIIVLA